MEEAQQSFIGRFISRLSYVQKFLIISLLYTLAVLIAVTFLYKTQSEKIQIIERQIQGNQYVSALNRLVQDVTKHQWLVKRYLSGEISVKEEVASLQLEINNDFRSLIALDKEYETNLKTTADDFIKNGSENLKPSEIQKNWEEYTHQLFVTNYATLEPLNNQIVNQLNALEKYIAESSKLFSDSNLPTAYFTLSLIEYLPRARQITSSILAKVNDAYDKKDFTLIKKIPIIEAIGRLQANQEINAEKINKAYEMQKNNEEFDKEITAQIKDSLSQYNKNLSEFIKETKVEFILPTEPQINLPSYNSLGITTLNQNYALREILRTQMDRLLHDHINSLKRILFFTIGTCLLSVLLAFILGSHIIQSISKPLNKLIQAAEAFARGDLSARIPVESQDEVGKLSIAFNRMSDSFHEVIGQLQWAGIQLATSSTEIAAAAKQQEATVLEQESTTKEIAVTAKEISTTAKEFARTMSEVSNNAEQTSAIAASGKSGLNQMELIMRQMVEASGNIATKLSILSEKAGTITTVITTISKVADQTNLLSLNAAIEAEKAGEQGRSFAVIAREIRRLADQTANATLDIERMVNEIVSAVSAGVMGVDKFTEEINTGVSHVTGVSAQLSKIIEQVQLQTQSFESVNQGMQDQSLGAEQINESIIQLSEAAQQSTASIRQFHKAIEQLNNAAQEMQAAVSKIKR